MGYVHDTQMSQFIFPSQIAKSAGTWTPTLTGAMPSDVRTAGDGTFILLIPIPLPSNNAAYKGALLKSIDLYYGISVAAADGIATVTLQKITLPTTQVIPTAAVVTTTQDSLNDTTAKRLTLAEHAMTITLTTPEWIDDACAFELYVAADMAATSVFALYGARANYTLRM
jgi:hypothetical protein